MRHPPQADFPLSEKYMDLSRYIGIASMGVAVVVILGWIFEIALLKSVYPGLATMKFNTALLFMVCGVLLAVPNLDRRVYYGLCAGVLLIAGISLSQDLFGLDVGIDQLVVPDFGANTQAGAIPGRMSIMTAVSFILAGFSLSLLHNYPRLSQIFALAVGLIALVSLVGYTYDVETLYRILPFSSMALHTALLFFMLALGSLLRTAEYGFMRVTASYTAGGMAVRRLLPVAAMVLLGLGWLRFQGQHLGLYDIEFGALLQMVMTIFVLAVVIVWTGYFLHRVDLQRLSAEASLQRSLDELENRVKERTSELLRTNQELHASEARFAGVLESAPDAMVIVNQAGKIVLVNAQTEKLFGYKRDELLAHDVELLIPSALHDIHQQHRQGYTADPHVRGMGIGLELFALRQDQSQFPVEVSLSPIPTPEETLIAAVVRDITERKRTEKALAASEQRLNLMINSVRDYALYMLDNTGNVASWSEGAEHIKGYQAHEIIGEYYGRFFTDEDRSQQLPEHALQVATEQGHFSREGWQLRKDGIPFWALTHITPIYGEDHTLIGFSKITRDLSERKKAEDAVRQSAMLLRQVLDLLPVGVWITDTEGNITIGNPAGHEIWQGGKYVGLEQYDEYVGWWADTGQRLKPDEWAAARAVTKGETSLNEKIEIQCFDGSHKFILNSAIPIRDENQNVAGAIIVNQDITVMKESEAVLRHYADALETSNRELEQFVYTASHDLQEPLRKIQAFGDRLYSQTHEVLDERSSDYLDRMINASKRMQNLIEDLLSYSRVATQSMPFKTVDLNQIIESVISDLEFVIEDVNAKIEVDKLATIEGDALQLNQLFQNLFSNSLKFHKPNQSPLIKIISKYLDEKKQIINEKSSSRLAYVEISFVDNGIGFDNKYADRIFKMFQRLHGRTEYIGTGIGLAICHKIVERHHGKISAHGIVGEGATFIINLPIIQKEAYLETQAKSIHNSDG